jgi:hypothetical protein
MSENDRFSGRFLPTGSNRTAGASAGETPPCRRWNQPRRLFRDNRTRKNYRNQLAIANFYF